MSDPGPAKLIMPLDDAQGRMDERIRVGEELYELEVINDIELTAARDDYRLWDDYNGTLVERLTDSPNFIYEYRSRVAFRTLGQDTFFERVADLRDDVQTKLRRLRSIRERLELLGTSGPAEPVAIPIRPGVFLAHGGYSAKRDQLELFLWRRGMRPIVVEEMPSLGMNPDAKVNHYMDRTDFGVILAEARSPSTQNGKSYPRLNVVDEIARVRKVLKSRFILLLEAGLSLPTNESGAVTYERFEGDSFGDVLNTVDRELREHGIAGVDD